MKQSYLLIVFIFALAGCAIQEGIDATNQVAYMSYSQQTDETDRRLIVRRVTLIQNRNDPTIYEGFFDRPFISEFFLGLEDLGVRSDGAYHYVSLNANPQISRDGVRIFNHENRLQLNLNDTRVIQDAITECNFPELMRSTIEQSLASDGRFNVNDIQRIIFEPADAAYGFLTRVNAVGWSGTRGFVVKLNNDYLVRIRLNNGDTFILNSFFTINDIYLTYDISARFSTGCSTTQPSIEPNLTPLISSAVLAEPGTADRILMNRRFLYRVRLDRSIENLQPFTSPGFATQFFGPFRRHNPSD